eukprot:5529677-Prorocentrum_lima.AAC.1
MSQSASLSYQPGELGFLSRACGAGAVRARHECRRSFGNLAHHEPNVAIIVGRISTLYLLARNMNGSACGGMGKG